MSSSPEQRAPRAPELQIRGADGAAVALGTFGDQPVVLAFVEGFEPAQARPEQLAAARAELRGLGAVLLVLASGGLWCFRPDDEVERVICGDEQLAADVAGARARYGVDEGAPLAVFVLDGERRVRFFRSGGEQGQGWETLVEALAAAGRALTERRGVSLSLSRRELVLSSLVASLALSLLGGCRAERRGTAPTPPAPPKAAPRGDELAITLDVNGQPRQLQVEPRVSLLDALREGLGLTGTKKGCDHGQCGACTVLVDGRRINACLTLAVMVQGAKITTIEGLAQGDALHPVQRAFVEHDGFQCGYCTPGQIMSAVGLLQEGHAESDDEIRELMSGNLCRCGAYPNIVAAIQQARRGA